MTDEKTYKWKNNERIEIDPSKYVKGKGTRQYIKARQCAAVYTKGARAGLRCSWYALKDSLHCKRHQGDPHAVMSKACREGHVKWWVRMKAIEAKNPGFLRAFMQPNGGTSASYKERCRMQRAAGIPFPPLVPISELVGTTDPVLLKAHKAVIQAKAMIGMPPDKPVEEMEPHEKLVHNLRLSLDRTTELLKLPIQAEVEQADGSKIMVIDYKAASIVKDTALRATALQVKVDRNALQAQRLDKMAELLERLRSGDEAMTIEGQVS